MGHTCPECGQYCQCGGDWDDTDMGDWSGCVHCGVQDEDDEIPDDDDGNWEFEDEEEYIKKHLSPDDLEYYESLERQTIRYKLKMFIKRIITWVLRSKQG